MTKDMNYFDKTKEFNSNIAPIITELRRACNKAQIPFFLTLAQKNDNNETVYMSDILEPFTLGYSLKDDKFSDFLNVSNGFETYYPAGDTYEDSEASYINEIEETLNGALS